MKLPRDVSADTLRVGTLHSILQDIADHLELDWQEFSDRFFSKCS